jgi:hypothetical protein
MSTLAYAAFTAKREAATPGTSTSSQAPGVRTWVDALAALVPAEVLLAHGTLIGMMTVTKNEATGPVTSITDTGTLKIVFYALALLAVVLYMGARIAMKKWDRMDWVRMFIPALAFIGWTMLQRATAFDAAFPGIGSAARNSIAIIGAIVLGLLASLLAYKADQTPTK